MAFTCSKCETKQAKTFSKESYTQGVVLVRCDGCNNLHLIADNLGWFRDTKVNI
jgi:protein import protein ZIM17